MFFYFHFSQKNHHLTMHTGCSTSWTYVFRKHQLVQLHIPHSAGCLLVFDLGNRESFRVIERQYTEVCNRVNPYTVLFVLVGHKCDSLQVNWDTSRPRLERVTMWQKLLSCWPDAFIRAIWVESCAYMKAGSRSIKTSQLKIRPIRMIQLKTTNVASHKFNVKLLFFFSSLSIQK